jgi:hypothetical protein
MLGYFRFCWSQDEGGVDRSLTIGAVLAALPYHEGDCMHAYAAIT